jgi:hypothetical protein
METRLGRRPGHQPDLFQPSLPAAALNAAARAKLLPLIEDLLTEIASAEIVAGQSEENGHDEDHA